ncbi:hypothetical protein [Prosthecodimorpha staleyi]|uniref:Uncharacterized protein n=1 Tax=Prosthecodimorpha staleyi TaxID=2840188 RepID=A0A947DCE8_9HYPH|nr:hypothetical protein [Prosthecodimorpha staleyi]MBT9292139.1 hypothetical protein [Prosthecodimorpha staleyi]
MLALAGTSASTINLTASLFASGGSIGASATGGGRSSGASAQAAVEISVTRSSTSTLAISAPTPRDTLAGGLKSLDASLDHLLAKDGDAQGSETLDRLQFLLDSLQMILKDRDLSSSDKIAMFGYLSDVATGKAPPDEAKAAFGKAMSGVADRANLPPDRAADYRTLLGTFATLPETPAAASAEGVVATVSRAESLSVSIKGTFEVMTDKGSMTAEFEFSQEMVAGFSAAIGDGEAEIAALSASRSTLSLHISATSAYRGGANAGSSCDKAA